MAVGMAVGSGHVPHDNRHSVIASPSPQRSSDFKENQPQSRPGLSFKKYVVLSTQSAAAAGTIAMRTNRVSRAIVKCSAR